MTDKGGRHLIGTAWLVGAGAFSKVLYLFVGMAIYKAVAVDDSGAFGLALAFATTLVIFSELGLRGFAVRELSKLHLEPGGRAQRLFQDIVHLRLGLALATLLLAPLLVRVLGYRSQVAELTVILTLFAILDSGSIMLKGVLRAQGRMTYDAWLSVAGRAAILALILACLASGRIDLRTFGYAHVAGAALECGALALIVGTASGYRYFGRPDWASMRAVLLQSLPFAVVVMFGILYLRTGVFVLSKLDELTRWMPWGNPSLLVEETPLRAVAWFTAAARLPDAVSFLPLAVVNAYVPLLSRNAHDHELVHRVFSKILLYLGLAGIVLAALTIAEPRLILQILAKPDFFPAAPAQQILGAALPLTFLLYVLANLLICLGEEKRVMRRYGTALAANIVFNLALVPRYGTVGAACAYAASEVFAVGLDLRLLAQKKIYVSKSVLVRFAGAILVLSVAATAIRPLPPPGRALLLLLAGGLIVTVVAWFDDRAVVRKVVSRITGSGRG